MNVGLAGKISVPLVVSPTGGTTNTTFTITWASAPPTGGRVFDVEIKRPSPASYAKWLPGTTETSASFTPDAGPGTYRFRSRLRDTTTGAKSGYSPGAAITVN